MHFVIFLVSSLIVDKLSLIMLIVSLKKIGIPEWVCIVILPIIPRWTLTSLRLFYLTALMITLISYIISTYFPSIECGNEFLRVDFHCGIQAVDVYDMHSISFCMRSSPWLPTRSSPRRVWVRDQYTVEWCFYINGHVVYFNRVRCVSHSVW